MPLVSVIVPCYNHGRHLSERMESILGQTVRDIEIILLDDVSTDGSFEILRSLTDARIKVCKQNDRNSGSPFKQWEEGLRHATAPWVWIAESDDSSDSRFLEKMLPLMNNEKIGLAYCRSALMNQQGEDRGIYRVQNKAFDQNRYERDYVSNGREECERYLLLENTIPNASAVIFRREALASVIGRVVDFRYVGDWFCYLLILKKFDIAYKAEALNRYRLHEGSYTRSEGALSRSYYERTRAIEGYLCGQRIGGVNRVVAGELFGHWWILSRAMWGGLLSAQSLQGLGMIRASASVSRLELIGVTLRFFYSKVIERMGRGEGAK